MKLLRILIPVIIAIILVSLTQMHIIKGVLMYVCWIVGFSFSMTSTAYVETKRRLSEQAKKDNDNK